MSQPAHRSLIPDLARTLTSTYRRSRLSLGESFLSRSKIRCSREARAEARAIDIQAALFLRDPGQPVQTPTDITTLGKGGPYSASCRPHRHHPHPWECDNPQERSITCARGIVYQSARSDERQISGHRV